MVSREDEGRDSDLVEAPHRPGEVETGPHVAPVAVEEVASENDEVDCLLDRTLNEVVKSRPGSRTNVLDGQAFVSRKTMQRTNKMNIRSVQKAKARHLTPS